MSSRKGSLLSERSFASSKRQFTQDDDIAYKAAYLNVMESTDESIHTRQELTQVLQYAGKNPTGKQINSIWSKSAGAVTFSEFCKLAKEMKSTSKNQLITAFKKIDINGDGFISESELYRVLTSKGEKMTHSEIRKILDMADANKDGKLDYEEFSAMVLSTSNECKTFNVQKMFPNRTDPYSTAQKPVPTKRSSTARPGSAMSRSESEDTTREKLNSQSSSRPSSAVAPRKEKVALQRLDDAIRVQGSAPNLKSTNDHPKTLKGWNHVHSKGCFFTDLEEDSTTVSHIYKLELPFASNVWLTIKPYVVSGSEESRKSNVDVGAFIYRESNTDESTLVAFTESKDEQQWYWRGDLRSGTYKVIPFTTGCRLKSRDLGISGDFQLTRKDQNGEYQLSRAFRSALGDVFQICDLDGNGFLNRNEFNWYQMMTSDEEVDDEAWQIVLDNLEVENDEITKEGFVKLHLMQAQEDGDEAQQEFADMMKHVGFNSNLQLDQGCPFHLNVYTKDCKASLEVSHLGSGKDSEIASGFLDSIAQKNVTHRVNCIDGLVWYIYASDFRTSTALENKTAQTIRCQADCSMSKNCMTLKGKNVIPIQVLPYSKTLVDHAMPLNQDEWIYHCTVTNPTSNSNRKASTSSRRSNSRKTSSVVDLFD
uniref:EF-hand calcium-binding domain-containing protein 7-like n=1 Tax=Phallusia mammillata TaxID=59560 RepID=A0A6F9DCG0_9ASCI|nr:EF-hand calcium-binding domain-containing protein 7-like [Phallusia mammillata]